MFCVATYILPNADALFYVNIGLFAQLTFVLFAFGQGFLGAKLELTIIKV